MSEQIPSTAEGDGRDPKGRFAAGNKASKGNVIARKAARCRAKLFATISMEDFQAVVQQVVAEAKSGESWACKLVFAYLLGEPTPFDLMERLADLEEKLGGES